MTTPNGTGHDGAEAYLNIAAILDAGEDPYAVAASLFQDDWVGAANTAIVATDLLRTAYVAVGSTTNLAEGLRGLAKAAYARGVQAGGAA